MKKEQHFTFSWRNLTIWYEEKNQRFWSTIKTKKKILEKVSGTVEACSLVGILGASGIGKTSLLATLAGKNNEKEGDILLNNRIISNSHLKSISSYVFQDDIVMESLTVLEHFKFMFPTGFQSALKMTKNSEKSIRNVFNDLNLEACQNTCLKNLSGGERKRIALGVELLNDPFILFCDEPTSGLDSYSALTIIKQLQLRAKAGKLVIVTIHQPSSQLFDFFSHIILLAPGRIFYQGTKSGVSDYFTRLNLPCPASYNPAEFYIKCIVNLSKENSKTTPGAIVLDNQAYVGNGNIQQQNGTSVEIEKNMHFESIRNTKRSSWVQIIWLVWRAAIDTKRNFRHHVYQFVLLMITASILAAFYSLVDIDNEEAVQNVKGILFCFTSELFFTHTYAVINTFSEEYVIFLREKPLYSTHSYLISKIIAITPRNFIQPLSFLVINFLVLNLFTGLQTFVKVFTILSFACMSGSMIGFCVSVIFSSVEYMDLFVAPFEILTMLAAGILLNIKSLVFFSWIKYISPFYYTYESLSVVYWSKVDHMSCKNGSAVCYGSGKEVLEELGFFTDEFRVVWDMAYMMSITILLAFLSFGVISYKRNKFTSY